VAHAARLVGPSVERAFEVRGMNAASDSTDAMAIDAELLSRTAVATSAGDRVPACSRSVLAAARSLSQPTWRMRITSEAPASRLQADFGMAIVATILRVTSNAKRSVDLRLASVAASEPGAMQATQLGAIEVKARREYGDIDSMTRSALTL